MNLTTRIAASLNRLAENVRPCKLETSSNIRPMNAKYVAAIFVFMTALSPVASANTNAFPAHLAGAYQMGIGISTYLYLGADGRYTNILWACSRGNSRTVGIANLSSNKIVFTPDDARSSKEPLTPVKWGDRQYLLDADEIASFSASIKDGLEPRTFSDGSFLLRNGDWQKPVSGRPELPTEHAKPSKQKLIKGKVVEVIDDSSGWIDLGAEHGLVAGTELRGVGPNGKGSFTVEQTYERQSRIKTKDVGAPFRVGLFVSTPSVDKK